MTENEEVTCPSCEKTYVPKEYVTVGDEEFSKCPFCGTINLPRVLSPEDRCVYSEDLDYDVDEEQWEEENPELVSTDAEVRE